MKHNKPFIYNPAQKTKEQLIAEFVVRKNVFEKLFEEVKKSPRNLPPQHYLIAGQRGMGKTTLLLRLMYAIEDDPTINAFLIPIRFSEEQYNIVRLEHLWEETASLLEFNNPSYAGLHDEMQKYEKEENYERVCFDLLEKKVKQLHHRVLLLIDNIGNLFDKFPLPQDNRLREILMTTPHIQLIGCSSKVLEHTFQYDKPFFEFFNQFKLEPLDQPSTLELLRALGKEYMQENIIEEIIVNNPQRIDVLRRITGGVPRTIVLLFDIFIDSFHGNAFEDLQHLLDEVNSLYKQRMDELKPQQQQIIDTLARAWDPITAKDVLERSKLYRDNIKTNQISAQLKQLTDNQVVETIEGKKRFQSYRIRERFFNIWYLMRHGRKQNKEEILWLIKFLEAWCTIKELKVLTDHQVECMQSGQYSEKAAYYKALAIHSIKDVDNETKFNLLDQTEKFLNEKGNREWADTIRKYKNELNTSNLWRKIKDASDKKQYVQVENLFLDAIKDGDEEFMNGIGLFYFEIKKDYDKAEQYYLKAIDKDHVSAMFNLALLYEDVKKDYDKAEQYYLKAIDKGHVDSMYNLALFYKNVKKDNYKAEQYYLKAIDKGHVSAMNNLAFYYEDVKKDYTKAEQYYLKAIDKGHVSAIFNLALFYEDVIKDYDKAEQYYLKAIDKGHVNAMFNLALFYKNIRKDYNKTEQYYLKAIDNGHVKAMNNFAWYFEDVKKDYDKAEKYFQMAVENGSLKALNNLALLYQRTQRVEKAENLFLNIIKKNKNDYEVIYLYINFLIKNNKLQTALDETTKFFNEEKVFENLDWIINIFKNLIKQKQFNFLLKLFKTENSFLMKHASPLYYVLAYFIKDELPGVYENAGFEIKETVDEIIKSIANEIKIKEKNKV